MSRLGRAEITLGEFIDLDETLRRLSRVTAAEIQQLANELTDQPISMAAVGTVEESALAAFSG